MLAMLNIGLSAYRNDDPGLSCVDSGDVGIGDVDNIDMIGITIHAQMILTTW